MTRKPVRSTRARCGSSGYALGSRRTCELEAGHEGPHGCAKFGVEGDEWITFDDEEPGKYLDWYAYKLWGHR